MTFDPFNGDRARIVAVGDIHGDLDALLRILLGMRIIDRDGAWCGQSTHLILIGDLNDRGPDSADVMAFTMHLEPAADIHGGRVDTLLGNHEILAAEGDYRYARASEVLALEAFRYGHLHGLHAFHRGQSPYARWLRRRPTIIQVASTVFVHAGLGEWALERDADFVNATVSAWVAHLQGVAEEPDPATVWLIEQTGESPLWSHRFRVATQPEDGEVSFRRTMADVLELWGAKRMVVGHRPTHAIDYQMAFPHPFFGDSVVSIDTGISRYFDGRLSAMEIIDDRLVPHYFERGEEELELTRRLRREYALERQNLTDRNES
jgi:hypothetical protein